MGIKGPLCALQAGCCAALGSVSAKIAVSSDAASAVVGYLPLNLSFENEVRMFSCLLDYFLITYTISFVSVALLFTLTCFITACLMEI